MNEKIIKIIDLYIINYFIILISFFINQNKNNDFLNIDNYNSFLIIRPWWIWDAVHLYSLIYELFERKKNIDILCMRRNKWFFEILKKKWLIKEIYLLDNIKDLFLVTKYKYDIIIDTEQFFYFWCFFSKLFIKSNYLIWFDTNNRRDLYDFFVNYRQNDYEAQSFLNLLKVFWINKKHSFDNFHIEWDIEFDYLKEEKNLCIFNWWSNKIRKISNDKLISILKKIWVKFDNIILIWWKNESEDNLLLEKEYTDKKIINYTWKLNLEKTLSLFKYIDTFISTDSWPLHLWVISHVKNIYSIFWPWIKEKWWENSIVIRNNKLTCIWCNYWRFSQTPKCRYNYSCLRDLEINLDNL